MTQTHYFELRAIPQIDLTEVQVMNQFMQTLHNILIYYRGEIGISFPCYTQKQHKTLGGIIRFFGKQEPISLLYDELQYQSPIRDYGIIFDVKPVPEEKKGYLYLRRIRVKGKSNLRRSKKRLLAQGKWTSAVEEKMVEKWGSVNLSYPHCHLKSSSTGQPFILWIKQERCDNARLGEFNSYGIGSIDISTVPHF